jgi:hypothetical protein
MGKPWLPKTPFFSNATRYRYPSSRVPGPDVLRSSSQALDMDWYILQSLVSPTEATPRACADRTHLSSSLSSRSLSLRWKSSQARWMVQCLKARLRANRSGAPPFRGIDSLKFWMRGSGPSSLAPLLFFFFFFCICLTAFACGCADTVKHRWWSMVGDLASLACDDIRVGRLVYRPTEACIWRVAWASAESESLAKRLRMDEAIVCFWQTQCLSRIYG